MAVRTVIIVSFGVDSGASIHMQPRFIFGSHALDTHIRQRLQDDCFFFNEKGRSKGGRKLQ
jgi:hypothetical protein